MRGLGSAHFFKLRVHSPISPTVRIRYKMTYFFKNAKLLYIFLVFFVDVKSQLFFPGPCPTPTPLPNINITRVRIMSNFHFKSQSNKCVLNWSSILEPGISIKPMRPPCNYSSPVNLENITHHVRMGLGMV